MLATIRDDTWNMLNMQHMTLNSKRWDCLDIPGGGTEKIRKGPPTWLKVTTTLEKPQHPHTQITRATLNAETPSTA